MQDIRKDLLNVINETMREVNPDEENGVVFEILKEKSISLEKSSVISQHLSSVMMTSKSTTKAKQEAPAGGGEEIKILIDGLKRLDEMFQQKTEILSQLASGQESFSKSIAELEDNVFKLKYLVLNSIQLPTKTNVSMR